MCVQSLSPNRSPLFLLAGAELPILKVSEELRNQWHHLHAYIPVQKSSIRKQGHGSLMLYIYIWTNLNSLPNRLNLQWHRECKSCSQIIHLQMGEMLLWAPTNLALAEGDRENIKMTFVFRKDSYTHCIHLAESLPKYYAQTSGGTWD